MLMVGEGILAESSAVRPMKESAWLVDNYTFETFVEARYVRFKSQSVTNGPGKIRPANRKSLNLRKIICAWQIPSDQLSCQKSTRGKIWQRRSEVLICLRVAVAFR